EDELLKRAVSAWHARNTKLARRAHRDDRALVELVRRDPRYLSADLLVLKVFHWKLLTVLGERRMRRVFEDPGKAHLEEEILKNDQSHPGVRAADAKKNLRELASAIRFVTGKGNRNWTDPLAVLFDYEQKVAKLRKARTRAKEGQAGREGKPRAT